MKRLTSIRCSGIKSGYWSPHKKDDLVQRLGAYEDTGLTPDEIRSMIREKQIREEGAEHGIKIWPANYGDSHLAATDEGELYEIHD